MSDDEIRKQTLKFLRGNSPATTREVRAGVTARAARVDEALRALLTEGLVDRADYSWYALRSDGTRYGHDMGRSRPSGVQASVPKLRRELLSRMPDATELIEAALEAATPERQRRTSNA
jgi:predicted transcriptional regulator